jgi:hypothetical protein
MTAMKSEYGKKKGEKVFYASANKGTIKGVHGKRKLTKDDIQKYGTLEEIKLLEGFEDEHGIDEIPLGDEQDQSLPEEEISLEDEQEAGSKPSEDYASELGIGEPITVSADVLEKIYLYISGQGSGAEDDPERDELLDELADLLKHPQEKENQSTGPDGESPFSADEDGNDFGGGVAEGDEYENF